MNDIPLAVQILRRGGLVAFPTETVYGLGADATNRGAVGKIFAVKGRPPTNPIIVHVADEAIARRYVTEWPKEAERLARRFWPGPLTLVLPRADCIAPEVSAGLATVGLRSPDHPIALELLRLFDGPVAAPSANRSTRVSPTTAGHVWDELGQAVDLVLDGGPCRVGIESTVLDLSGTAAVILRPGSITPEQIEGEIGPVGVFKGSVSTAVSAASPGQHAVHYAPRAAAYRFSGEEVDGAVRFCETMPGESLALLGFNAGVLKNLRFGLRVEMPGNPEDYARSLYAALRQVDVPGVQAILVETPPDEPRWAAIRDRLTRATRVLPE